jgi:hypothetical protein
LPNIGGNYIAVTDFSGQQKRRMTFWHRGAKR